jgi:cellulose synthase/poly-beta-1,6-N-acetylglucosamine synthase-like glycosyltransferase
LKKTIENTKPPRVSIIIPCKSVGDYAEECVAYCNQLDYPDFEIIVLPDELPENVSLSGVTIIPTGPVGPSQKRDLAGSRSTGEIFAFIDDDAYPQRDWLTHAVLPFSDDKVGAVGGPAITPPSDALLLQASGAVYQSLLGGGPHAYRYVPGSRREVDDYPSCNLLVRKSVFLEAGGFGTEYWPGEDTKLCLAITKHLGKSIAYEPKALVYHHRRNLFRGHMKQVASYALHRGFFVKRFPETSRRLSYFMPSLFVVGLLAGLPFLFVSGLRELYLAAIGLYLALVIISSAVVSIRHPRLFILVIVGTIFTQLTYGAWFLKGLTSRSLAR